MKENSLPRIVVIILCTAVYVAVLVVNAFAGAGRGEFKDLPPSVTISPESLVLLLNTGAALSFFNFFFFS